MVFKKILVFLRKNAKSADFERQLKQEFDQGHILDTASDNSWYLTLGQTVSEFVEAPAAVLRIHTSDAGVTCHAKIVHYIDKKRILIGDIEAFKENRGYGSIMIRNIIELAKQVGVIEITGNLTSTDGDHFDKLEHFYTKHGFEVHFFDNRSWGKIIKVFQNVPGYCVQHKE